MAPDVDVEEGLEDVRAVPGLGAGDGTGDQQPLNSLHLLHGVKAGIHFQDRLPGQTDELRVLVEEHRRFALQHHQVDLVGELLEDGVLAVQPGLEVVLALPAGAVDG